MSNKQFKALLQLLKRLPNKSINCYLLEFRQGYNELTVYHAVMGDVLVYTYLYNEGAYHECD